MSDKALPAEQTVGMIERVAHFFDAVPTGATVSATGRIFINYARWGDDVPFTVAEIRDGKALSFPDAAINACEPKHSGTTLISVQSVVVDPKDRSWVLDTAAPGFAEPGAGGAKLVVVDLTTDMVVKTILLSGGVVLRSTHANEVRFDLRQGKEGAVHITDSLITGPGGIIVVDLATGEGRRRLSGRPSTMPDLKFVPVVAGERQAVRETGTAPQPFAVGSDGIALSADGATLHYRPLSSRHLYAVLLK
ncbi:hypothetical protein AA23498_1162 [Acetobacter nitrogenifigens DSM 23921 = NBRC 105050]|uniref:Gluconolaconase n=1 Tax=Acetobacter nitrogenifigens DSM 23921 = NBRC 105050 TaxID=1120919 RepID=A0A511XAD6_9PROT|nr:L-dopachrome tautomerase-related protein [Acetobacter nitrogenifigens]GBQ91357.1 hypothetical protein AA23498_1162 [Acetobacter nitrogenifigens DSM 23921 = NBRC 105050]GEN59909.1 hypothetical protein ANI02nite_17930 [Acetobacter nitrogenifigens DSM 23921 = NBRC 105050]